MNNTVSNLPKSKFAWRIIAIGATLAGFAGLFAYAGGWLTPHSLTPASMIDTFEQVNGYYPGFRRNHSKGVCFTGVFESNGKGAALSKASVFAPGRVPVIGRFALASGQPFVADSPRIVRSMALLFKLPNGEEWRTGMNNIPVFAVSTAQAFHDLIVASAAVPATGKPDPEKMRIFLSRYPESARAMALVGAQPISSGFGNSAYNSLNAFHFTSAEGKTVAVRWAMLPEQPFEKFEPTVMSEAVTNALFDDLLARMHTQPLRWRLVVTVGQPGDPTHDATLPWPSDRTHVDVGTLTIYKAVSEDISPARDINFDPLVLPVGISGSDDPLLSARSAAYARSFTRRESERKLPSAVSVVETTKGGL